MRECGRRGERGTTLLEAMVAMAIIVIGFIGILSVNKIGLWLNGSARSVTRATAIADDLAEQMALWSYDDARLANGPHVEENLGATWSGIPTAVVKDGVPFTRTWTVQRVDDLNGDGVCDGARVAITVSSSNPGTHTVSSEVTVYTFKNNPAEMLPK